MRYLLGFIAALTTLSLSNALSADVHTRPNVVLIYPDDQGYGDLGCFGSPNIRTPNIDRLASEGVRLTDFYVAQAVCTSSRAALLTGCYSNRIGLTGALGPKAQHGINDNETTLAELLKGHGYATAIYGKWHLGHLPKFLPTRHGFDDYFGLPYSNDMWPFHPGAPKAYPPLPLIANDRVTELNPDQSKLTTQYTERAVKFIEDHAKSPFFVYVPHSMPHVPLHVSDKRKSKSNAGLYGDVIEEIDWSVGQITDALQRTGVAENTLVIFATDNGPWLSYGNHAGSAGKFREGKATAFEGGVRVPCIMRLPGRIAAGSVVHEPVMTIDILPTIAELVGATLPQQPKIDGRSIWPLLTGKPDARNAHEVLYFYWINELHALRSGPWKLHMPHRYTHLVEGGADGKPGKLVDESIELSLYNLENDPSETRNVAEDHPDVVERMLKYADQARTDLGDKLTGAVGAGLREPGRVD